MSGCQLSAASWRRRLLTPSPRPFFFGRRNGIRAIVSGAAGFIGSHLCDRLLADGHEVVGIDCFRDYYPRTLKEQNLVLARTSPAFAFCPLDLAADDLNWVLDGADVVFHLAGRSGLGVASDSEFGQYVCDNVLATQRLLEALEANPVQRIVYAGSSSIYGDAERLPTKESVVPRPLSSYGVTKLAGENLVLLYGRNFGLPVTVLRYFTVYGPRQRPDMAIARFMRALVDGDQIEIHGDGEQTRDFTFVDDVVEATVRCATADVAGEVLNIGGGARATINAVLGTLEEITGIAADRQHQAAAAADQRHAAASINEARRRLDWEPRVGLRSGLERQWSWFQRAGSQELKEVSAAV
jgi:UDP-glucose 4-epimerase